MDEDTKRKVILRLSPNGLLESLHKELSTTNADIEFLTNKALVIQDSINVLDKVLLDSANS